MATDVCAWWQKLPFLFILARTIAWQLAARATDGKNEVIVSSGGYDSSVIEGIQPSVLGLRVNHQSTSQLLRVSIAFQVSARVFPAQHPLKQERQAN